ncbi:MAG: AI-2E family transporter [Bryobacteraceae bacterium]
MEVNRSPRTPSLLGDIGRTLAFYVRGQIRVSAILALLYAVGFALSGVPGWPFVAVMCGFANLIPIVGSVIALGIAALITWFGGGGLYNLLGVLATFVVAQGLEGFYITPRVLGREVSVPPLTVFAALLIGGALFGFFGLLLAVPLVAILMVSWRHFHR